MIIGGNLVMRVGKFRRSQALTISTETLHNGHILIFLYPHQRLILFYFIFQFHIFSFEIFFEQKKYEQHVNNIIFTSLNSNFKRQAPRSATPLTKIPLVINSYHVYLSNETMQRNAENFSPMREQNCPLCINKFHLNC